MKRSRKPSKAAPSVRAPRPLKVKLAPVMRTYKDITIELLPDQKERCQDPGCGIGAAFRVTWPDRGKQVTLVLCAHHSQVTVARFRERLRAAASIAPSGQAATALPPTRSGPPPQASAESPKADRDSTALVHPVELPGTGTKPEGQD